MRKCVPAILSVLLAASTASAAGGTPPAPQASPPASTSQPATQPAQKLDPKAVLKALGKDVSPLVEKVTGGEIDWTKGEIRAIGTGKLAGHASKDFLMAQQAARLGAARNAVLLMSGLRVGPGGKFANVKEGQVSVDAVLRDFRETDSDYDPKTDTVTSTMAVPLYGVKGVVKLMGVVLTKPEKAFKWSLPDKPGEPTLIIIDARGSDFRPCVLPRIVNPAGEAVDEFAARNPERGCAVTYVRMDAKTELTPKPTAVPSAGEVLIFRAAKSSEKNPGALVLPDEAVKDLDATPSARYTPLQGIVVIIAD